MNSHHRLLQSSLVQAEKRKSPKIVVMSPTVATKSHEEKEGIWQLPFVLGREAEHPILGGKHFLIFGTRNRKNMVVEEGEVPLPMDKPAWKKTQVDFFTILAICHDHWNQYHCRVSEWILQSGKFGQYLETLYTRLR